MTNTSHQVMHQPIMWLMNKTLPELDALLAELKAENLPHLRAIYWVTRIRKARAKFCNEV